MSENTERSADDPTSHSETTEVPNPHTGVGIGAGEPSTFEPEEDTEAVPDDAEAGTD